MIATRTLRIDWKSLVHDGAGSSAFSQLLSNHVLSEWQPSRESAPDRSMVMYAHHVLFDYASARLILRGDPASLVMRLTHNPDLAIVIRPSFLYHFRYLWSLEAS